MMNQRVGCLTTWTDGRLRRILQGFRMDATAIGVQGGPTPAVFAIRGRMAAGVGFRDFKVRCNDIFSIALQIYNKNFIYATYVGVFLGGKAKKMREASGRVHRAAGAPFRDSDVDVDAPICIGMDYNANINWIVAGQPRGRRLNVIKSFYVKFERKTPTLVEDFCRYYASHRNKTVVYYYDATALGSNYAVNEQDFHFVVCHVIGLPLS